MAIRKQGTAPERSGQFDLVIVSNRGPLTLVADGNGGVVPGPTVGGLTTALGPTLAERRALWISAPMTDIDRQAAGACRVFKRANLAVQFVKVDPDSYHSYYDVVANGVLWPLYHGMLDPARIAALGPGWARAWSQYRVVNIEFAKAVAAIAPQGARVLVQDYHLHLVGRYLRLLRSDLRVAHFSHTPFCTPTELRQLPVSERLDIVEAMSAYAACGFHSSRWEAAFRACCQELRVEPPKTFVAPLGVHRGDLAKLPQTSAFVAARREMDSLVGDRRLIVRVDRLDPAKNLIMGFEAFSHLLADHPDLRGKVVFWAHMVPSRQSAPEMRAYRRQVEETVEGINARWQSDNWTPIVFDVSNDRARAAAALRRYDVLLVNAIRDGMNLVALEGALSNRHNGTLVLSRTTGVWERLCEAALPIDPSDRIGTTHVLREALNLSFEERRDRAARAHHAAGDIRPDRWLDTFIAMTSPPDLDRPSIADGLRDPTMTAAHIDPGRTDAWETVRKGAA